MQNPLLFSAPPLMVLLLLLVMVMLVVVTVCVCVCVQWNTWLPILNFLTLLSFSRAEGKPGFVPWHLCMGLCSLNLRGSRAL